MAAELRASPSPRCGKVLQKPCWRAGSGPCPPRTAPARSHASVRGEKKGETEAFLASPSAVANKCGRSARGAKARRSPAPRHCPPGPAPVPEPIRSSGALPRHRGPCRFKACDPLPEQGCVDPGLRYLQHRIAACLRLPGSAPPALEWGCSWRWTAARP